MENVNQIEINTKAGQSFGGSLRSVLRQDPDVVMIGEIRDEETAKVACQAANTGHMVFSTIHANDSITALFRLIDLGSSRSCCPPRSLRFWRSGWDESSARTAKSLQAESRVPEERRLSADKVKVLFRPRENKGADRCTHCSGMATWAASGCLNCWWSTTECGR